MLRIHGGVGQHSEGILSVIIQPGEGYGCLLGDTGLENALRTGFDELIGILTGILHIAPCESQRVVGCVADGHFGFSQGRGDLVVAAAPRSRCNHCRCQ